jgi:hypothetical protein
MPGSLLCGQQEAQEIGVNLPSGKFRSVRGLEGIVFKSTTSDALTGWPRRPSRSTSVRFVPTPRKLAEPMPSEAVGDVWISPVALNWVCAGVNCGIWFKIVSMLIVLD